MFLLIKRMKNSLHMYILQFLVFNLVFCGYIMLKTSVRIIFFFKLVKIIGGIESSANLCYQIIRLLK